MGVQKSFLDAVKSRRTYYALKASSPIPDSRIQELVRTTVLEAPSSFNSQSTRLVVLLKAEHEKLWDATKEILRTIVPADKFAPTEKRIEGFRNAYGTILFFEDPAVVKELQANLPLYSDKFPVWYGRIRFPYQQIYTHLILFRSEHTSAIHQYILWTALEAEGLGANLQHYNPLIDRRVQAEWNVPEDWSLKAQLVFGTPAGLPGDKTRKPVEERVKVYGK